jgi:hypothetical protein
MLFFFFLLFYFPFLFVLPFFISSSFCLFLTRSFPVRSVSSSPVRFQYVVSLSLLEASDAGWPAVWLRHGSGPWAAQGDEAAATARRATTGEVVTVDGVAAAARTLPCDIHGHGLPLLPPHRVPPLPTDPARQPRRSSLRRERSGHLRPGPHPGQSKNWESSG